VKIFPLDEGMDLPPQLEPQVQVPSYASGRSTS